MGWTYKLALVFQLFGLTSVGLCFISGIQKGDYGRVELAQFILGIFIFYVGIYLKSKSKS